LESLSAYIAERLTLLPANHRPVLCGFQEYEFVALLVDLFSDMSCNGVSSWRRTTRLDDDVGGRAHNTLGGGTKI